MCIRDRFYTFLPSVFLTYLAMGKAQRSHAGYRPQWTYMSVIWPMTMWFAYTLPLPRRLYTEIVSDKTDDGSYVRQRIKQSLPGLWRRLSRQLLNKGYRFPEINEVTEDRTQFPTDFISKH
eukprot:TRINITY_DN114_c0_g1_i1.p1 TRINITY_DN114_c0_g1~~TRINITY_DN114_c0_g1_i1.p1  ORF type:complete len:141 (+),score=44.75 TRINITY_DN114_c0_g1_i1:62-424(+)